MAREWDPLASWASLLGAVATILGLLQSTTWLTAAGIALALLALVAMRETRRSRSLLRFAAISVEGTHVDSLNLANLRRRLNRSLVIQQAIHQVLIDGQDLSVAWRYDGYCDAERETTMEFSIDAEVQIPFPELDCRAFDLRQDPACSHRIRPILLGPDGLSKKVAVPFLQPLSLQDPFHILLRCALPGCLSPGVQYYTSTLSFAQDTIAKLAVHLVFLNDAPAWLRVYELSSTGQLLLLKELSPCPSDGSQQEYLDVVEGVPGQSARVYVFHRLSSVRERLEGESRMRSAPPKGGTRDDSFQAIARTR